MCFELKPQDTEEQVMSKEIAFDLKRQSLVKFNKRNPYKKFFKP